MRTGHEYGVYGAEREWTGECYHYFSGGLRTCDQLSAEDEVYLAVHLSLSRADDKSRVDKRRQGAAKGRSHRIPAKYV
jgi:hypothetical protein